jgi:two-component system chemotaxis response regulator CheB
VHGPRENGFRPAIDPLFRTAARELGRLVIGVVLSGALSDGTYGLSTIKQYGGVTIVQDPDDAVIPNMPQSAIESVDVDYVLPASEIAYQIERSARKIAESPEREVDMPRAKGLEPQQASEETEIQDMNELFGPPSGLTCPDCGGALWQVEEGRVVRYQCHVGHQYAPENLESAQRDEIDGALWSAVRVLEEHADLKQRMARRALAGGMSVVSEGFAEGARDAHQQAQRIRGVLFTLGNGKKARSLAADNPRSREAPRRAAVKKTRRSSARAVRKRKA